MEIRIQRIERIERIEARAELQADNDTFGNKIRQRGVSRCRFVCRLIRTEIRQP